MKRIASVIVLISCFILNASSQDKFIDHLSIGLSYGTTSMNGRVALEYLPLFRPTDLVSLEVAAELTQWLEARAGISSTMWRSGSQTATVEGVPDGRYVTHPIEISNRYGNIYGNLFFDFYPFRKTSFHFTAGIYAGAMSILKVYSNTSIPEALSSYDTGIVELYGLTIPTDRNGEISAKLKQPAVRPYAGIGINTGRMRSNRVYASFDLGIMYKGNKGMTITGPDGKDVEIDYWHSENTLARMVKWNKKCVIAPLLSIRLFVKIF